MTAGSTAQRLEPQPWMTAPETQAVVEALTAEGAEVRFVGGCVRDALAGRPVKDVDLATPDRPEKVMELLQAAGIKAVPTGLDHGTVTAVSGHHPFEITTLRLDVETDGRRAVVAFTDDWLADAARRDLTFNAMSCRPDGWLFDPFGGLADLAAGRVHFVGDPRDRIQEDYLRLLRFFRFQAHYGRVPPDAATLAVARELAPKLAGLSGERVRSEILRLLSAPDPLPVLELMLAENILAPILPQTAGTAVLRRLMALDLPEREDAVLRLAALLRPGAAVARAVAQRLRLSNAETAELELLGAPEQTLGEAAGVLLRGPGDPALRHALATALYRAGAARFRVALVVAYLRLVAGDEAAGPAATAGLQAALAAAEAWQPREFPLSGADVLELGYAAGPDVGSLLRAVEDWWIGEDFAPDRAACLARLKELAERISPEPPKAPGT
ncbi:CCA tRNA nucleotidyltransferase [Pelagibius marinus]|uniref:CCA tRNA nucleotidyltransferase n=1 Tax=Pelagibius marinus TaxID=2762760 RepID=UPI00187313F9|nr:CCA tRNA nucleotidyltransferase [Pelagibius marinus]